jgi:predicted O-methyltransferase YrrM/transcriptional regulator with XRE-family HTH domain
MLELPHEEGTVGPARLTFAVSDGCFGALLRGHRVRLLLSQEGLAQGSGLSVRTIRGYEAGRSRVPRSETVRRLADALELAGSDRSRFESAALPLLPGWPEAGCECREPEGNAARRMGRKSRHTRLVCCQPMQACLPELVRAAVIRARRARFAYCDPAIGRLLAVLAAHLPPDSQVLELGSGSGVGTAWIVSGLLPRTDVTLTTIEKDLQAAALAVQGNWPDFVHQRTGDVPEVVAGNGSFDLIFANSQGGKWEGLDHSIDALSRHGLLVADGMAPCPDWTPEKCAEQDHVRQALLTSPLLTSIELDHSSRMILSVRRA